jgi:hypothetical protein
VAPTPGCYAVIGWRRRTESGRPATNIRFSTATPMELRSVGPQGRGLAAAVRSASCSDPLSFLLRTVDCNTVTGRALPGQPALCRDHRQMAIRLYWCIRFAAGDSRRAWRNHNLDAIAVLRDRLIGGCAIIRTVRGHLSNRIVTLIEPRADLGRIVDVLIRQRLRHDHVAGRIHRQMQLASLPLGRCAGETLGPGSRSAYPIGSR